MLARHGDITWYMEFELRIWDAFYFLGKVAGSKRLVVIWSVVFHFNISLYTNGNVLDNIIETWPMVIEVNTKYLRHWLGLWYGEYCVVSKFKGMTKKLAVLRVFKSDK